MHSTLNLDGVKFGEWVSKASKTGKVRIHEGAWDRDF